MWQKIKTGFQRFMMGRNGTDNLAMTEVFVALAFSVLGIIFTRISSNVCMVIGTILSWLSLALYIHCLFRMFSRNREKRQAENRKYLQLTEKFSTERVQAMKRFQNRKEYKYFRCPNCKVRMRLKRGSGIVTVTCRQCHNSFTQKS